MLVHFDRSKNMSLHSSNRERLRSMHLREVGFGFEICKRPRVLGTVLGGIRGFAVPPYGEGGNDIVNGGNSADFLLGNAGDDSLFGGPGNDLLIGSRTTFDSNRTALFGVVAEWDSGRSYSQRISNLQGTGTGPRLNGTSFLKKNQTVLNAVVKDTLRGDDGRDWFFAFSLDSIIDKKSNETST